MSALTAAYIFTSILHRFAPNLLRSVEKSVPMLYNSKGGGLLRLGAREALPTDAAHAVPDILYYRDQAMFGYLRPLIPELRVKDKELYQAYYCGLCHALGRYGLSGRASLTYDATFAALLLTAVCEKNAPELAPHSCALHPMRGKTPAVKGTEVMDFCAALCVLLAKYKLIDDGRDGHPMRKCLLPFIAGAARKAEKLYPDMAKVLELGLADLSEVERERVADADIAPVLFGELLSSLLLTYPAIPDAAKPMLKALSKAVGGFIYTIDAWDDRKDDQKRGCYNMFNCIALSRGEGASAQSENEDASAQTEAGSELLTEAELHDMAEAMLDMYVNSAALAYDLLDAKFCKPLLDNIIYQGLGASAEAVLLKKEGDK